jgi:ornithine carbamoyltransferase
LTDLYHPCQVLSDIMTIVEKTTESIDHLKIVWVGDGNNMAHSWINAASILGLHLVLACPEGYFPDKTILARAGQTGLGTLEVLTDPMDAVKDAHVINTDVWASMGQEADAETRKQVFQGFTVDEALVAAADDGAIVMHCLPAHRGEEISEAVLEGSSSVVWDQAENKLHMHKAILETSILA